MLRKNFHDRKLKKKLEAQVRQDTFEKRLEAAGSLNNRVAFMLTYKNWDIDRVKKRLGIMAPTSELPTF